VSGVFLASFLLLPPTFSRPCSHSCCSDVAAAGRRLGLQVQSQVQLTPFEAQLSGCRTIKSQPLPFVDITAPLRLLDAHTPEQRQQAQAFAAAVGACSSFECLQQANQLVSEQGGARAGACGGCWSCCCSCHLRATSCVVMPACSPARSSTACLLQPRAPGQFRYPHFFVLGFPKCATTSIYW
jgi:hypothetical protein